jgi:hypothetical protein
VNREQHDHLERMVRSPIFIGAPSTATDATRWLAADIVMRRQDLFRRPYGQVWFDEGLKALWEKEVLSGKLVVVDDRLDEAPAKAMFGKSAKSQHC